MFPRPEDGRTQRGQIDDGLPQGVPSISAPKGRGSAPGPASAKQRDATHVLQDCQRVTHVPRPRALALRRRGVRGGRPAVAEGLGLWATLGCPLRACAGLADRAGAGAGADAGGDGMGRY